MKNVLTVLVIGVYAALIVVNLAGGRNTHRDQTGTVQEQTSNKPFAKQLWHRVLVVAHRGNSSEAPENTLTAIQQAFDLGVDMVEIDVHRSKDGIPVVIHNDRLEKTTNGKGPVSDFTVAELKRLDAGSWLSPKFAEERIPTLEEVLQVAKSNGKKLLLDQKVDGLGNAIATLVTKTQTSPRQVVIGAWTLPQTADFAQNLPGAQILRTDNEIQVDSVFIKQQRNSGVNGFELGENWSPEFVEAAHQHGMTVYAYTINDEIFMRELIEMGVDAIETDYPRRLLNVVREMGGTPSLAQSSEQWRD